MKMPSADVIGNLPHLHWNTVPHGWLSSNVIAGRKIPPVTILFVYDVAPLIYTKDLLPSLAATARTGSDSHGGLVDL